MITAKHVTDVTADSVADPFMIHDRGTWYLFYEVCNVKTKRGEIGFSTSKDLLKWNYGASYFRSDFICRIAIFLGSIVSRKPHIARPGGRVIVFGNQVIRYAQDDSPAYGNQVWAFEVVRLTPTDYEEKKATDFPIIKATGGKAWNGNGMPCTRSHRAPAASPIGFVPTDPIC